MKREKRILVLKTFSCKDQEFSLFFIIRGMKNLEHFALLRGGSDEVVNYLSKSKLIDEVQEFINLSEEEEEKAESPRLVRRYLGFINRVFMETHKLICYEPTTNNLGNRNG